ncbi:MAG: hypothetical protein JW839_14225 [Candidatus Lokiarchaeota archaeon]|nr:hypothetical protein [Candidatus Lokiarchaeota archaeon]
MKYNVVCRVVAKIVGGVASAFFTIGFMLAFIAGVLSGEVPAAAYLPEMSFVLGLLVASIIGFVFAWIKHGRTGLWSSAVMIASGLCLLLYFAITRGTTGIRGGLLFGLPFIISGLFFTISFRMMEREHG